jgi:hypothetical protein
LPAAGDLSINTLPIASNLEAMETQPKHNTEEIEPAISNIEKKGKEHWHAFSGMARSKSLIFIALSR